MAEAEDGGIEFLSETGSGVADSDEGDGLLPTTRSGLASDSGPIPTTSAAETFKFLLFGVGAEVKGMMLERGRML